MLFSDSIHVHAHVPSDIMKEMQLDMHTHHVLHSTLDWSTKSQNFQ